MMDEDDGGGRLGAADRVGPLPSPAESCMACSTASLLPRAHDQPAPCRLVQWGCCASDAGYFFKEETFCTLRCRFWVHAHGGVHACQAAEGNASQADASQGSTAHDAFPPVASSSDSWTAFPDVADFGTASQLPSGIYAS